MVKVSAPGKLMLMGEHAVVYGYPCLVTAIDRRLMVEADKTDGNGLVIVAPQSKDTTIVEAAVAMAKDRLGIPRTGLRISTQSPFTGVYGFGSSSATAAAVVSALSALFRIKADTKAIFTTAYEAVSSVQPMNSGFDVAAGVFGATLSYAKGGTVLEVLEQGNTLPLVVGYTRVKANTTQIVAEIAEKKKRFPEKVGRIFSAIEKLVGEGKASLQKKDWQRLGTLFGFNQDYLRDLGVSSEELENLIAAARNAGAFGAKLSGAGRGDCMIALVPDDKRTAVETAITQAGGEVVRVLPHAQGARLETTDDQSELFVVVDKNDSVIGYRTRGECHSDRNRIHRAAGVIIFDSSGRVLLQKRSLTKDISPGVWGISTAGHVRKGKSYEETARREMQEELGISVPITFWKKHLYEGERESEFDAAFRADYDGPFTVDPIEVDRVEFFDPRELKFKIASGEVILDPCAKRTLEVVGIL